MRLLDLYCGAGGAAEGYARAGFTEIIGVDIEPQPNYPYLFIQADVLTLSLSEWVDLLAPDLIHASPPCQYYAAVTRWRGTAEPHPDLVPATRQFLHFADRPYVIENVREAGLADPVMLCGSMFGLEIRRHRYFETSWMPFQLVPSCFHGGRRPFMHKQERAYADAMGCEWMTVKESRQAIPPAYTEWVGSQFMAGVAA